MRFQSTIKSIAILILALCGTATSDCKDNPVDTTLLFNRVASSGMPDMIDLADSALKAGDEAKALSLYMAVSGFENSRCANGIADTNAKIRAALGAGNILAKRCNYAGALDFYIKGLKLSEAIKGHPLAPTFYKNIGNIYTGVYDYEQAMKYYKMGLAECAISPDAEQKRKLLVNAAVLASYLDLPEESQRYIEQAEAVPLPADDEFHYMKQQVKGMILEREEKYDRALEVFRQLGDFAVENEIEPRYRCSIWEHLYFLYDRLNMPDSVIAYMRRCEREVYENDMINMFPDMLKAISEFYDEAGDRKNAQLYKLRYIEVRDSIINDRDFNAVKNMQFQYEAAKIAGKIDILHRQKEEKEETIKRQTAIMGWTIAGVLGLAFFLIVIWRQKRRIAQSYRSIYDINHNFTLQKEALEKQLKEKSSMISSLNDKIIRLESSSAADDIDAANKYSSSNLNEQLRSKLLADITEAMENDMLFTNPDFSLDMLAEKVGSNTKYVSQTINEALDKNFSNFVNDYRVKLACRRLADDDYGNLTVKAIGESVGFKSQSAFTSVFRKHTGLTPSMFQKLSKESDKMTADS